MGESANEIPPLGTLLHLSNEETNGSAQSAGCAPSWFGIMGASHFHEWLCHCTSSGVPREDTTVKACLINDFQYESRLRKQGQRSFAKYRNMNRSYQRCQKKKKKK